MVTTPLAIVWRCALDVRAYVAAGRQIAVPRLACPDCGRRLGRWSGYWRWVRGSRSERLWIGRGRCRVCRRSHALLPDFVLVKRLDRVEVIGRALALALSGVGLRSVARRLDVPHTTARSWWRRFQARAPTLTAAVVALAVGLDGAPVRVSTDGERAALDALVVTWQRAHRRWGERVGTLWRFWSRITGGQALGTTTISPLAGVGTATWIAPSP